MDLGTAYDKGRKLFFSIDEDTYNREINALVTANSDSDRLKNTVNKSGQADLFILLGGETANNGHIKRT